MLPRGMHRGTRWIVPARVPVHSHRFGSDLMKPLLRVLGYLALCLLFTLLLVLSALAGNGK